MPTPPLNRLRARILVPRCYSTLQDTFDTFRDLPDRDFYPSAFEDPGSTAPLLSYKLNRQRNNRINGCNCRGIAVMCVQCTMRIDDKVK
jgi:hypothetical protein